MLEKYLNNRFFILYFLPFCIGSLSVLSFSPFNFTWINFIIFPFFFYLIIYINKKSKSIYRKKPYKKNLFLFGLLFGFGFYLSGISWISNSLTFDENFKILIPFALVLVPLFLSLFTAIIVVLVGTYLKYNVASILLFSGSIAVSDYLRAKLFTGFPWNLWAYSTSWANEILQILSLTGFYTYNLLVITFFTLPAVIFFKINSLIKFLILSLICLVTFFLYIYGNYEINKNNKLLEQNNEKFFVKVISPNFDLKYGLSKSDIEDRFKQLIRYSDPNKDQKTLFVWPAPLSFLLLY